MNAGKEYRMKVLLIEDHPIVRAGCRRLLTDYTPARKMVAGSAQDQDEERVEVIEASTGAEGVRLHREHSPAVVVLDLNLPDMPGLEVLAAMKAEVPSLKVIVFSMYEDPAFVSRALEGGASAYLTKNDDPFSMLEALDKVIAGGMHLGPRVAEKIALHTLREPDDPLRPLSRREREVFDLLGQGRSLNEIAVILGVSYRTAAHAALQIRSKLGYNSAAALIKYAVERAKGNVPA
ncbi:Two-component response regulator [Granulibacter bethesdensis]|nr:Two-component response regulator [Granulibacter bethesdensis]